MRPETARTRKQGRESRRDTRKRLPWSTCTTHECTDETKTILSYAQLIVFGVTVSIGVCFTVYDLPTSDAEVIAQLFKEVLKEAQLDRDTIIARRDSEDGTRRDVRVTSEDFVIFSGFYKWRPPFEESLQRRVTEAVPHAKVSFEWHYPDINL